MADRREEERPLSILQKLKDNCNMQATAHAWLRDWLGSWNLRLTIAAVFMTAMLLPFSLASDPFVSGVLHLTPNGFKLANAAVALIAFGLVLVQLAWQPGTQSRAHGLAVEHYTKAKLAIQRLEQSGDVTFAKIEQIQEFYLDQGDLPPIPEKRFIDLKRWHMKKLSESRAIDSESQPK